jgi:TetR/AcrR family transcriptional repressor of nem operon
MTSVQQPTPARRGPKPKPHTRTNLIRAGVRMLHEAGYSATGIQDIVDAAEVPKGSFYNHFESKESFGAEVVDAYFEAALVDLRGMLANPEIEPLERLKTYFATRFRSLKAAGYVKGCLLGNLSLEVSDQSDAIRERLSAHFKTWSRLFEDCIAQAQKAGTIRNRVPAPSLAPFVLNSWEGTLLRMRVEKNDAAYKDFIRVMFENVLV